MKIYTLSAWHDWRSGSDNCDRTDYMEVALSNNEVKFTRDKHTFIIAEESLAMAEQVARDFEVAIVTQDAPTSSSPVSIHPDAQFVDIAKVRALVTSAGSDLFSKENMRGKRASNCAMLLDGTYYFVMSGAPEGKRVYIPWGVHEGVGELFPLDFVKRYSTSKEAWQAIDAFIAGAACSSCGASTEDGEGYDGLCGNCADKTAI